VDNEKEPREVAKSNPRKKNDGKVEGRAGRTLRSSENDVEVKIRPSKKFFSLYWGEKICCHPPDGRRRLQT